MDFLNVIVKSPNVRVDDRDLLFPEDEEVIVIPKWITIQTLLIMIGAFESKSQAKKNFKEKKIPDGWSHFVIGKLRRELCIWNPTE